MNGDQEDHPAPLAASWSILKTAVREWLKDDSFRLAAALAYYTVFSLAPLLLVVIAVADLAFDKVLVRREVLGQMEGLFGPAGATAIVEMLDAADQPARGLAAAAAGLGVLVFGASGVFTQIKSALNTIWGVRPQPGSGMLRFLVERFLSFAMVLVIGFLLLVSLTISAFISGMMAFMDGVLPLPPPVLGALDLTVSLGLTTVLFALIYKVLPDVKLSWNDVWIGAAVTAALFAAGKFLIGLYLGRAAVASAYGAAGSAMVILLWAYYSSLIFLLGAEFTEAQARYKASRPEPKEGAELVSSRADHGCRRQPTPRL